jgi:hypothetical protein
MSGLGTGETIATVDGGATLSTDKKLIITTAPGTYNYVTSAGRTGSITVSASSVVKTIRQVATKCWAPTAISGSTLQAFNSRSPHYARDDITSLKIVLPTWYWDRVGTTKDTAVAGLTYTAAIEYPSGTFTQVRFGGNIQGVPSAGVNFESDLTVIAIPKNAMFWVRVYGVGANGFPYIKGFTSTGITSSQADTANGQVLEYGATSAAEADKTMGGTLVNSSSAPIHAFTPVAIVANSAVPAIFLAGDSRVAGTNDQFDASGNFGETARSVGPTNGYINMGSHGDTVAKAISTGAYTNRGDLAKYCTHVIDEYGINDVGAASPAASIWANCKALYAAWFGSKPIFRTTLIPRTTSSDSWATAGNQTVTSNEAIRTAFNAIVRANPTPLTGFFETADSLETARDSGIWLTNGTANAYTKDGVHESQMAYQKIKTDGRINPSVFV